MKAFKQTLDIVSPPNYADSLDLYFIAVDGPQSNRPISVESYTKHMVRSGYTNPLRHLNLTVAIGCARDTAKRLMTLPGSFSDDSRPMYGLNDELYVVEPTWFEDRNPDHKEIWISNMNKAEQTHKEMLREQVSYDLVDGILPAATATRLFATFNFNELRDVINRHYEDRDIAELMGQLRAYCVETYPAFFSEAD